MMRRIIPTVLLFFFVSSLLAQSRPANKLTVDKTYFMTEIKKPLRDFIDGFNKEDFFKDDFFDNLLRKIVIEKKYSEKEKAQLFYLMEKRVGYSFVGLEYLPPLQSYFTYHTGKTFIQQHTAKDLKDLNYNVSGLLAVVDSNRTKDAILAGNALLLATILNSVAVTKKLETLTQLDVINASKNPDIFNHYVCMSASISQNQVITANLTQNLMTFRQCGMIEDVLCAIYSKDNYVTTMKVYILNEKNPKNDLAIETALCALAAKVPKASHEKSIKALVASAREPWKTDLCQKILDGKIPFNYGLTSKDQLVNKVWEGVTATVYADGTMVLNGKLMEFDPN
ncbi:MAG: hypothetical protein IT236_16280 [Bacteroidia bacterium]|nr:hypothetical protein [Bacteroidia bacterium]